MTFHHLIQNKNIKTYTEIMGNAIEQKQIINDRLCRRVFLKIYGDFYHLGVFNLLYFYGFYRNLYFLLFIMFIKGRVFSKIKEG